MFILGNAEALTAKSGIPPLTDFQKSHFIIMVVMAVVILVMWNVRYLNGVLYPFKLITVAFHEFGHAGVLTGAKIISIELDPDLGGKTVMRGGNQYFTLPAGYLGSSIVGSTMVFCSFNVLASQIASGVMIASLFLVLYWAKNWLCRMVTVMFMILAALGFWLQDGTYLTYFILWMGVMSALYSTWDIVEDLVVRKVNSSDASVLASKCGCCTAQMWGVIWFVISLGFLTAAVIGAIYVFR